PDAGSRYALHVSGGKYTTESPQSQPTPYPRTRVYGIGTSLPECDQPLACRLFAVPDLNGDGSGEIAVQSRTDHSMRLIVLYGVEVTPARPPVERATLSRLAVAPPGDPWADRYGVSPGPATLVWGASPHAIRFLSCGERAGSPVLIVTAAVRAA